MNNTIKCPKCGYEQEANVSCLKCGVIFAKIKNREVRQEQAIEYNRDKFHAIFKPFLFLLEKHEFKNNSIGDIGEYCRIKIGFKYLDEYNYILKTYGDVVYLHVHKHGLRISYQGLSWITLEHYDLSYGQIVGMSYCAVEDLPENANVRKSAIDYVEMGIVLGAAAGLVVAPLGAIVGGAYGLVKGKISDFILITFVKGDNQERHHILLSQNNIIGSCKDKVHSCFDMITNLSEKCGTKILTRY